ncbi:MAG: hypothetical protein IVW55_17650, partial [Chloroflexi bacterium]|nr:hypothetical protein [Chloroflexota bacterium]
PCTPTLNIYERCWEETGKAPRRLMQSVVEYYGDTAIYVLEVWKVAHASTKETGMPQFA